MERTRPNPDETGEKEGKKTGASRKGKLLAGAGVVAALTAGAAIVDSMPSPDSGHEITVSIDTNGDSIPEGDVATLGAGESFTNDTEDMMSVGGGGKGGALAPGETATVGDNNSIVVTGGPEVG